jgi:predicted DsbA family dithiol-disulfide isomerase
VEARQLAVFADYASPICYLAEAGLTQLAEEGVDVERRAFEVRPAPAALVDPRSASFREEWDVRVRPLAERLGCEIRTPPRAVRTRKAHEAAAFARSRGMHGAMNAAIYRAYFVEGRDIGRIDVLVAIGEEVGFDPVELKVELDVDRWTEQVVADETEAARLGITTVPAYAVRSPIGALDTGGVVTGIREATWLRRWLADGTEMENGT